MKTFRNLSFVVLIAAFWVGEPQEVTAFSYPDFNCPSGCSCTITPGDGLEVTGDCPEAAPIEACPLLWVSCDDYCFELGPHLSQKYAPFSYSCGAYELLGACYGSYGLEPPTEDWICGCYCWVS